MLFSVFYLSLFLSVGLLLARRAVPDGSVAVIVPLGCGFGVSLLAVLPALFAVVLGFTLPAAALAAAAATGIGAALLYRGTRLRGMAQDPDSGALWACLLPVVLITLYLLHTHVLHLVDGAYHTGQSCYGDMPMHLGFIKYIAQSGEFLPRYPLLGGTHRFGYPFLCETVSSVFVVLGADLRTAYLLPMLPAFLSVYGMFWHLARRVTDSVGKACLAFYLFFMGSGLGFAYFLGSADSFAGIFTGFYTTPTNFVEKNIEWVNPIVDLLIPQRATLFGWCVLLPAVYLLWRVCVVGERRLYWELFSQSISMGLMSSIVSAGSVVLQYGINGLGTLVIAGHTAARKLFAFTDMPLTAMASACSTYVSQNYGANHPDRVRRGMRDIYLYGVVVAVTAILLMSVGAEWMVKLVSGSSEPVVLENGVRYLVWNAPFYAVLGMLLSTRYALQSMGEKVLPLLSSVIEFLGKIVFVLLFIPRFEYNAVILCEPVIWCFMTIELLIAYRHNSFVFPKMKK